MPSTSLTRSRLGIALLCGAAALLALGTGRADEVSEETVKPVQGSVRHPLPIPAWSIGLGMGVRSDSQELVLEDGNGQLDSRGEYSLSEFDLLPRLTAVILPGRLSLSTDMQLDFLYDRPSQVDGVFLIESFAFGGQYTLINSSPFVLATSLGLRFISQSYQQVFSMDVFHIRPYVTGGPIFDPSVLSIGILPYFGIPMFFDSNEDNDPSFATKFFETAPGSQGGPYLATFTGPAGTYHQDTYLADNGLDLADEADPSLPPNRRNNLFLDESPGGIDYGLPIVFSFEFGLFLIGEVYGTTWLWPTADSWNYIGPTIGYSFGVVALSFGLTFALDHKDQQPAWWYGFGVGVSF